MLFLHKCLNAMWRNMRVCHNKKCLCVFLCVCVKESERDETNKKRPTRKILLKWLMELYEWNISQMSPQHRYALSVDQLNVPKNADQKNNNEKANISWEKFAEKRTKTENWSEKKWNWFHIGCSVLGNRSNTHHKRSHIKWQERSNAKWIGYHNYMSWNIGFWMENFHFKCHLFMHRKRSNVMYTAIVRPGKWK